MLRRVEQIAAQLADVLERRDAVAHAVAPERATRRTSARSPRRRRKAAIRRAPSRRPPSGRAAARRTCDRPAASASEPIARAASCMPRRWLIRAAFGSPVVPLSVDVRDRDRPRRGPRARRVERVGRSLSAKRGVERLGAPRSGRRARTRAVALRGGAARSATRRANSLCTIVHTGSGHRDAVRERVAAQVVVDQRGDRAELREPDLARSRSSGRLPIRSATTSPRATPIDAAPSARARLAPASSSW